MKQWKGFITGMLATIFLLALASVATASVGDKNAVLTYKNIKITLDGVELTPKDAGGNVVEPFIIDGTTYLPVRGIANALGLGVEWIDETNTVALTKNGAANSSSTSGTTTNSGNDGVSYKITYQNCRLQESSFGSGCYYTAIVEIENTGTENIYLKNATFDFEDRSGHLLETKSFISEDPDIISPGEKGYYYSSGSLDKLTINTDYVFKPVLKVEKSKNPIVRYAITDTSKEITDYDGLKITGRIQNNTTEDASIVWVAFILYRYDGTPIIAGGTNILDLKAGEMSSFSKNFYKIELGVSASEVASYKVFACKLQYQF